MNGLIIAVNNQRIHRYFKRGIVQMLRWILILFVISQTTFFLPAFAQSKLWTEISPNNNQAISRVQNIPFLPSNYRLLSLDESLLSNKLNPLSVQRTSVQQPVSLDLPLPNGKMVSVDIGDSAVMPPVLAAKFPEIKTYRLLSRIGTVLSGRIDYTPNGFHAMLDTEQGTVFIDPRQNNGDRVYISYYKKNYQPVERIIEPRNCAVNKTFLKEQPSFHKKSLASITANRSGDQLRTYRLAVAATGEYTNFHGGTVAAGMAAIVTTINRVNQIYNRDLSVQLQLVANNDLIVYTNGTTDPYSNNNGGAMLSENIANLSSVIGNNDYDVGHVFSTNGGGVAFLGVICNNDFKGGGVTGTSNPINDPFYIDFVAHELGHQFAGNHIFNGNSGNCSGFSRNGNTAYEPGSGSTIQGYAGICGSDNLQSNTDPMFSSQSIDEMVYHTVSGSGASCGTTTANGNTAPNNVNAGADYTIPAHTPFEMTGSATDIDGDTLTYSWEQFDLGPAQGVNEGDNGSSPLFRAFLPSTSPTRTFPRLTDLLNNTIIIGETLPTTTRTLTMRLTVRDQNGGVDKDTAILSVEDTGVGFEVTSQNSTTTLQSDSAVDITWNVAGTTGAPINCPSVDVLMSTDGGLTFPTTLSSGVANDGAQSVILPSITATEVRFKVKCSNNIYFDINNANITIEDIPVIMTYEDAPASPISFGNTTVPCGSPITRIINIPDSFIVDDMLFGLTTDHTRRGDIQVTITSPYLTTAEVIDSNQSDNNANYDVLLDDSQSSPLNNNLNDDTSAPFYNRAAAPGGALSVFNGENASGDWLISVCDVFSGDDGLYYRSALKFPLPDFDNDGIPDLNDPDDDNDGAPDVSEVANSTDPLDNTDYPQPYSDVDNTHPAYTSSLLLTDSGIVDECDNSRFCPDQLVTNNLFAKWALKSSGTNSPPIGTSSPVSDVNIGSPAVFGDGDFAADWIVEYLNQNLTYGCDGSDTIPPTLFCPQGVVTKASAAFLALRALEGPSYMPPMATGSVFNDVDATDYAADWVEELFNRGEAALCEGEITQAPRRFCPQGIMTRGDLANLLQRVFAP